MAQSPAHRLGQSIGQVLESAIHPLLVSIAHEYGLYLDFKHPRPGRDGKSKVAWKDAFGNTHDLDYVLEEGGSENTIGRPRAFVEVAWRRYTKHSRNKAQEIQSAIRPLAERYQDIHPFLGVVLGGTFTDGSLEQLRSHDFNLVYCPYDNVARSFADQGADITSGEDTSEDELRRRADALDRLSSDQLDAVADSIRELHADQFTSFFGIMRGCLGRHVAHIFVLSLSGETVGFDRIEDAISFVEQHDQSVPVTAFVRYELNVRYSNGDEVRARFKEKESTISFLRKL